MRLSPKILTILPGILLIYSSCSRNILQRGDKYYSAPAMGAESRFDEGLRKEKHPQQLWSKKERKDMEKAGTVSPSERSAPATKISPMQADSLLTGKKPDSTRSIPAADSTPTIPIDTSRTTPDTTRP
jgi:hypothetical protein